MIYILQHENRMPGAWNIGVYSSLETMITAIKEKAFRPIEKPAKEMGLEIWTLDGQIEGVHTVCIKNGEVEIH